MKPEEWQQGTVDAIATASADGRRIVIKAVNYEGRRNTLLVRLQGARAPEKATARLHTITAGLTEKASLERPDAIRPVSRTIRVREGFGGGVGAVYRRGGGDSGELR